MNRIITLAFLILLGLQLTAQKYGYVNSSQLLINLPDVKTADSQLEAYQKQLIAKGEQMVKSFETEYKAYLAKVDSGELSQIDMQQREGKLAQDQQAIQAFEVQVQNDIAAKKQELYQPILARVQKVVDAYGKEEGYTMIFDASIGGILFADTADDLMPVLKTKLGIQ
jgi:outer membrane protein